MSQTASERVRAGRADIPQLCFLVGVSTSKNARCSNDAAARLAVGGGEVEIGMGRWW